jgi:hypothetical protein
MLASWVLMVIGVSANGGVATGGPGLWKSIRA